MKDDRLISFNAALDEVESIVDTMSVCISMDECKGMRRMKDNVLERLKALPSAQTELENKIRAIGYTGREGRIYIGGRLFAVRELPQ